MCIPFSSDIHGEISPWIKKLIKKVTLRDSVLDSWSLWGGSRRQGNFARNQHHQHLDSAPLNLFSSTSNKFWLAYCSCLTLSEFLILSMVLKELRTCYRFEVLFQASHLSFLGLRLLVTEPLAALMGHIGKGHSLRRHWMLTK